MNQSFPSRKKSGFTLLETVIAVGILAVLLTGFVTVMTPATRGFTKAHSAKDAGRLAFALKRELSTLRKYDNGGTPAGADSNFATKFDKSFDWIRNLYPADESPIIVYQYRGQLDSPREDGTLQPFVPTGSEETVSGKNSVTVSMARRINDPFLIEDLETSVGQVMFVKFKQLVKENDGVVERPEGEIWHIADGDTTLSQLPDSATAADYDEAYISFVVEFYTTVTKSNAYIQSAQFIEDYSAASRPVFKRNFAIGRF